MPHATIKSSHAATKKAPHAASKTSHSQINTYLKKKKKEKGSSYTKSSTPAHSRIKEPVTKASVSEVNTK